VDSGKFSETVTQQTNIARQIGVQSTPSFLVNGTPLVGAQPFESFQQLIEQFTGTQ
jgi:protein-disulfide isomerase